MYLGGTVVGCPCFIIATAMIQWMMALKTQRQFLSCKYSKAGIAHGLTLVSLYW